MKISAFTIGSENVASSRLRSFYLFHSASKYDVAVLRNQSLIEVFNSDCLHLQKLCGVKFFLTALAFRCMGKKVIFDFDDQHWGLKHFFYMILHMLVATHVTTDTKQRKEYWQRFLPFKKFSIIPDIIDIDPACDFPMLEKITENSRKNIVWVGSKSNIGSIVPLIMLLRHNANFKMTLITDEKSVIEIGDLYPWIDVVKWHKKVLYEDRYRMASMVLNHDVIENSSRLKSDNKMVLAIAAGIIPVVSNTPAYMSLAKKLNSERLVFSRIENAMEIIESFDEDWVLSFFQRSRFYIRNFYSEDIVFKQFLNIITH